MKAAHAAAMAQPPMVVASSVSGPTRRLGKRLKTVDSSGPSAVPSALLNTKPAEARMRGMSDPKLEHGGQERPERGAQHAAGHRKQAVARDSHGRCYKLSRMTCSAEKHVLPKHAYSLSSWC